MSRSSHGCSLWSGDGILQGHWSDGVNPHVPLRICFLNWCHVVICVTPGREHSSDPMGFIYLPQHNAEKKVEKQKLLSWQWGTQFPIPANSISSPLRYIYIFIYLFYYITIFCLKPTAMFNNEFLEEKIIRIFSLFYVGWSALCPKPQKLMAIKIKTHRYTRLLQVCFFYLTPLFWCLTNYK